VLLYLLYKVCSSSSKSKLRSAYHLLTYFSFALPPLRALERPDTEPFFIHLPAQARKAYPWLSSNVHTISKTQLQNPTRHFFMVGFLHAARQCLWCSRGVASFHILPSPCLYCARPSEALCEDLLRSAYPESRPSLPELWDVQHPPIPSRFASQGLPPLPLRWRWNRPLLLARACAVFVRMFD